MDEDMKALLDMVIGLTVAQAALSETLIEAALIDRASLVEDLRAQEAMMQNECQALPLAKLVTALEARGGSRRSGYSHLVLVQ